MFEQRPSQNVGCVAFPSCNLTDLISSRNLVAPNLVNSEFNSDRDITDSNYDKTDPFVSLSAIAWSNMSLILIVTFPN